MLTNAIYFKGDWEAPFRPDFTEEEDFHLSATKTVKAPLMFRIGDYNYFAGGTFQALELPYKTGELSMIVFLPNDIRRPAGAGEIVHGSQRAEMARPVAIHR